jgi:hypothetical protein
VVVPRLRARQCHCRSLVALCGSPPPLFPAVSGPTIASRGPPAGAAGRFPVGFAPGRPLKLNVGGLSMVNKFEERRQWAEKITKAIDSREIEKASRSILTEYSTWLCSPLAPGEFGPSGRYEEVCEVVRLHMLRTMMDDIEKRNALTQRLVIALTVAALIVGIPQLWFAYKADKRAETEQTPNTTTSNQSKSQTSSPTLVQPPSTDQVASPAAGAKAPRANMT